jgi:hypothetical protein
VPKREAVVWDVAPLRSVIQFASYCIIVPSSQILSILMMEVIRFFETSFATKPTRRHIPKYGIIDEFNYLSTLVISCRQQRISKPLCVLPCAEIYAELPYVNSMPRAGIADRNCK